MMWKGLCEDKGIVWHQNKDYVGGATIWASNWLYNSLGSKLRNRVAELRR